MKARHALWALPLLGMLTVPAVADHRDRDGHRENRFEQRLDRQDWRIRQGIRSGELTHREARRLREGQRHIARMEQSFSRDGGLDRFERHTLRRELNGASDRIYRLKHNERYRAYTDDRDHRRGYYAYGRHHEPKVHDHYRGYGDAGWAAVLNLWDFL